MKYSANVDPYIPYSQNEYAISRPRLIESHHINYHPQEDGLPYVDSKIRSPFHIPKRILPDISLAMKRRARQENTNEIKRSSSLAMRDLRNSEFHCENRENQTFEAEPGYSETEYSDLEEQYGRSSYRPKHSIQKTSFSRSPSDNFYTQPTRSKTKLFYTRENVFDSPVNSSPLEYDSGDSRQELRQSYSQLQNEDQTLFRNIRSPLSSPDDTTNLIREEKVDHNIRPFNSHSQNYSRGSSVFRKYNHLASKKTFAETWT